jgi:hypothetical protein
MFCSRAREAHQTNSTVGVGELVLKMLFKKAMRGEEVGAV